MTNDSGNNNNYSKHDLSFALGGIERQLESITKTQAEDRMASAQWRTDLRSDMKSVDFRLNSIQSDTNANKRELDEIKPIVTSLEERATMSRGAANMALAIGKIWHLLSALIGAAVAIISVKWFNNGAH